MRRLRCPSTSSVQKEKLRGRSEQQTAGPPKFPPLALLVVPRRPRTGPSKRRSEEHWRGVWRKAGGSCDKFARLLFSSVVGLRGTCGLVELIARRDSFFLETCHKSASLSPSSAAEAPGETHEPRTVLFPWQHRHCVRAAKEMDSKCLGLCPQGVRIPSVSLLVS